MSSSWSRNRGPRLARFWRHVDRMTPDECWLWTGPVENGHGVARTPDSQVRLPAHLVSFVIEHGTLPLAPRRVEQRCRQPLCVNPAHLAVVVPAVAR